MQNDLNQPPQPSTAKKVFAVLFEILCIAYSVLPVDMIPDPFFIAGWADDVGLNAAALLNLLQVFSKNQQSSFVKSIKYIKQLLIIVIFLLVLIFWGIIICIIIFWN